MIHGIYIKTTPKSSWYLMAVSASAEAANEDKEKLLKEAKALGNDRAEVIIQLFESPLFIPEILHNIKKQTLLYN